MNRITEIKRRYAKGEHHKAQWMANTVAQLARELGVHRATMIEALASGKPPRALTQAQFDEAVERVEYGKRQQYIYRKNSPLAICKEYRIGDRTLRSIVEDSISPEDPVRKFLTMRLVA